MSILNLLGPYLLIIIAFIIVFIVVVLIVRSSASREKESVINQVNILTDELDRQKNEKLTMSAELKRITSQDNLFFASMIRLVSKFNINEIVREVVSLLVNYIDVSELAVFLTDSNNRRLQIAEQFGINDNWVPKIVYAIGESKVGITAEKKIPLSNRDFDILRVKETIPIFNPDYCHPLVYQDKILGVIAMKRRGEFDERDKNLLGVVSSIASVAIFNSRSFANLQDFASLDPLTKLFNIGFFKDRLGQELERAKRFQHDLSMTIIDLDHFKDYNDTFGHQAGDHLLIQLAEIFRKNFRETDTIARYGGDEFIVMLPETKKPDAGKIVHKVLKDLEMYDFSRGKTTGHTITFSAGVSSYPEDGAGIPDLIKSSDEALYEAKGAGRNTVRLHTHKIENI
jgi:two-component system cell cycle response regulator